MEKEMVFIGSMIENVSAIAIVGIVAIVAIVFGRLFFAYLNKKGFGIDVEDRKKNKESAGVKGKHLFMPIRVAVIGKPHGAELKMLVPLMAKSELLARADKVLASI